MLPAAPLFVLETYANCPSGRKLIHVGLGPAGNAPAPIGVSEPVVGSIEYPETELPVVLPDGGFWFMTYMNLPLGLKAGMPPAPSPAGNDVPIGVRSPVVWSIEKPTTRLSPKLAR